MEKEKKLIWVKMSEGVRMFDAIKKYSDCRRHDDYFDVIYTFGRLKEAIKDEELERDFHAMINAIFFAGLTVEKISPGFIAELGFLDEEEYEKKYSEEIKKLGGYKEEPNKKYFG